jgi:hypothetical protein
MNTQQPKVGDSVIFIDSKRTRHAALVTHVWPGIAGGTVAGANVVFVSNDEARTDPYGRQLERATSIVHLSAQPAGAFAWCWPSEDSEG